MTRNRWSLLVAAPLMVAIAACSDADGTGPEDGRETLLLSVVPTGGATDVDPSGPVEVRFNHAMMPGMEAYVLLHRDGVTGPAVDGTASFSTDRTTLTFRPAASLEPATRYTIHLGGGMMDDGGHPVDWQTHGPGLGGDWATDSMMGSGMGSGVGMGGARGAGHMGPGWEHANGSYGMVFGFTTAG